MLKGLLSFQGRYRTLHLTWFAFFLTFVNWFNFAPFASVIGKELGLDYATQIKTIGICNLALTIPARIIIGMILDRFGPRVTFSTLLMFSIVPCFATAMAGDFNQLIIARLLMGLVGAGFVVGIRMVSELKGFMGDGATLGRLPLSLPCPCWPWVLGLSMAGPLATGAWRSP
jgi:MFS transporter, NNP family, nitrate/nitrite transporter